MTDTQTWQLPAVQATLDELARKHDDFDIHVIDPDDNPALLDMGLATGDILLTAVDTSMIIGGVKSDGTFIPYRASDDAI